MKSFPSARHLSAKLRQMSRTAVFFEREHLNLRGVTRQIEIPTKVTVNSNDLRAVGEFSIDRGDFNVKATSAFHGWSASGKK